MNSATIGPDHDLIERIRTRPLYLWGAGQTGIGMLHALSRLGIRSAGFIDQRKESLPNGVLGVPVFFLKEVLAATPVSDRPFIINTSAYHVDAIAAQCLKAGLKPHEDFISYEELCPFDYQVVVSSICNLRCVSCPVGNRRERMHAGFMKASQYAQVLDKILAESPLLTVIQLFNWGEPFLNRDLARIVDITNERNVLCSLSSNMNLTRGFDDVIAARPAFLRISMSGNEERYGITHTGGRWSLLMKNLEILHELRNRYNPATMVEVAYHVYATTTSQDLARARELCQSLGFVFRPHLAALLPLDNVLDYIEGNSLSDEAHETIAMLRLPIEKGLVRALAEKEKQCSFERTLNIESDLSVKHCGLWIRPGMNRIADNYLETPIWAIYSERRKNRLCSSCKGRGLHRFCSVYTDEATEIAALGLEETALQGDAS